MTIISQTHDLNPDCESLEGIMGCVLIALIVPTSSTVSETFCLFRVHAPRSCAGFMPPPGIPGAGDTAVNRTESLRNLC